jgi:hypothetical protein
MYSCGALLSAADTLPRSKQQFSFQILGRRDATIEIYYTPWKDYIEVWEDRTIAYVGPGYMSTGTFELISVWLPLLRQFFNSFGRVGVSCAMFLRRVACFPAAEFSLKPLENATS